MIKMSQDNFGGHKKGNFAMKFANGYTVSLAMGDGMYSSGNFDNGFSMVEVAAWDADGNWVQLGDDNDVLGWCGPNSVLDIMNRVAAM
jgi:hypothetical protein